MNNRAPPKSGDRLQSARGMTVKKGRAQLIFQGEAYEKTDRMPGPGTEPLDRAGVTGPGRRLCRCAWATAATAWPTSRRKGLFQGAGGDRFIPDAVMTRSMLAEVLYRYAGSPAVTGRDLFRAYLRGLLQGRGDLGPSEAGCIRTAERRPEEPQAR